MSTIQSDVTPKRLALSDKLFTPKWFVEEKPTSITNPGDSFVGDCADPIICLEQLLSGRVREASRVSELPQNP